MEEGAARDQRLESVLRVERARLEHDGIFTCGPSLGIEDSVRVHVIDGKQIHCCILYGYYSRYRK